MICDVTRTERHDTRRIALQGLYALDVQGETALLTLPAICAESDASEAVATRARELVEQAWRGRERADRRIQESAEHWDVARMDVVDRNILRLAVSELLDDPETPARVVIDEAIELAKEFGSAESPGFVNGVLDAIWRQGRPQSGN